MTKRIIMPEDIEEDSMVPVTSHNVEKMLERFTRATMHELQRHEATLGVEAALADQTYTGGKPRAYTPGWRYKNDVMFKQVVDAIAARCLHHVTAHIKLANAATLIGATNDGETEKSN